MALPNWVRFSQSTREPAAILTELANFLVAYELEPVAYTPLGVDPADGWYGPLYMEKAAVADLDGMVRRAHELPGASYTFFSEQIGRSISLVLIPDSGGSVLALSMDGAVIYQARINEGPGSWIMRFLHRLVFQLELDCCGLAIDERYEEIYDALSVAEVQYGIETGHILRLRSPNLHLLSDRFFEVDYLRRRAQETHSAAVIEADEYDGYIAVGRF